MRTLLDFAAVEKAEHELAAWQATVRTLRRAALVACGWKVVKGKKATWPSEPRRPAGVPIMVPCDEYVSPKGHRTQDLSAAYAQCRRVALRKGLRALRVSDGAKAVP